MVILGLGSNLGDKLSYLHQALLAIKAIQGVRVLQVSPLYCSDALMPENAPDDWNKPYINLALRCETTLNEFALLDALKKIEWSIGRKPEKRHWGPREIDIDILAWDDRIIDHERLTIPHRNLHERPFALWPLADVAPLWSFPIPGACHGHTAAQAVEKWGSRFSGDAPFHTRQIQQRIDTPALVGILNVTPDSFSDGGVFFNPESALSQFNDLIQAGAQIIDVGAESTSPTAVPIDPKQEWGRLEPILQAISAECSRQILPPKISVDTRHPWVAEQALKFGIDWINDVTGCDDPRMREIIASAGSDCVIMHHLSIPERRGNVLPRGLDPVHAVYVWGEQRIRELEAAGIAKDRIIFDPGIGFGKMAEQSLRLLQHTDLFKQLGTRLLIGHSRKSFMTLFTDQPAKDRDVETLAMSLSLLHHHPDYLRIHQVDWCARAFKVAATMAISYGV